MHDKHTSDPDPNYSLRNSRKQLNDDNIKRKRFKKTLNNPILYHHVPDITRSIQKRSNFIIQVYSLYTEIKESIE